MMIETYCQVDSGAGRVTRSLARLVPQCQSIATPLRYAKFEACNWCARSFLGIPRLTVKSTGKLGSHRDRSGRPDERIPRDRWPPPRHACHAYTSQRASISKIKCRQRFEWLLANPLQQYQPVRTCFSARNETLTSLLTVIHHRVVCFSSQVQFSPHTHTLTFDV